MKLAIVGLGYIAQYQLDALSAVPEVELVAACDTDPGKRVVLPDELPFFTSVAALLEGCSADVYLVSTPTKSHFEIADTLLSEGRNVAIEKPACMTRPELDVLAGYAEAQFVYAALHAAFGDELAFWKQNESEYRLGALRGFNCCFYDPYVIEGELQSRALPLVGAWTDSGINALSVIGSLIPPEYLECEGGYMRNLSGVAQSVTKLKAQFRFAYGASKGIGHIETNWLKSLDSKTTLLSYQKGDVLLNHSDRSVTLYSDGKEKRLADFSSHTPRLTQHYQALFRDMYSRFQANNSNFGFAARLHELFLRVQEPLN